MSDVANDIGLALINAVAAATSRLGLAPYATAEYLSGSGTPLDDACEGLLWSRLVTLFPTDGSGQQFTAIRFDSSLPAWAFQFEVGFAWCRRNVNEDGSPISADEEISYALRDGEYRSALYVGVVNDFIENWPACVSGQSLSAWTPIGPDGGFTGGITVVTVVSNALIC